MAVDEKQPTEATMATENRISGTDTDKSSPNTLSIDINNIKGPVLTDAVLADPQIVNALTPEHRQYLLDRHGTLDLDPIPGYGPGDPLNWPYRKKFMCIFLVAFNGLMATLITGAAMPSFETIAKATGVTLERATYICSSQILMLGVAPFVWRPLALRFGYRPVFLISILGALIFNAAISQCESFGALITCCIFAGWFVSPSAALGTAVVHDVFFSKERARYMGVWQFLTALGVPLGPVIFGFVTVRAGYHWIWGSLAIVNGVQFVLYALFGPETRLIRNGSEYLASSIKKQYLSVKLLDTSPFTFREFYEPLTLIKSVRLTTIAWAYSSLFVFSSVLVTLEIPVLFIPKFHLTPSQLGLQFLAIVVGNLLGEQIGGYTSDYWMKRKRDRSHKPVMPEFRLWVAYLGYALTLMGSIMFLVLIADAKENHWTIKPLVGAAFAGAGGQVLNTVVFTYGVDIHPRDAASIGVYFTFIRQTWGFISPFWLPTMFTSLGLKGSAGLVSGLLVVGTILPTVLLHAVAVWRENHKGRSSTV